MNMSAKPLMGGHEHWSSRFTFFLAALGVSVGLGNIWRFPYMTGENGGGAFILIYLACAFGIGVPLLIAELSIGRRGGLSPIGSMRKLAIESGASPLWGGVGVLAMLALFLVLTFYMVVTGWTLDYFIQALNGNFSGISKEDSKSLFDGLMANPLRLAFWQGLAIILVVFTVARGIKEGLERAVKILMPLLFICLLFLVVYACITGDFATTFDFMIRPDFSKVTPNVVLAAIGQAFFSIGIAFAAMMTFGAYLDPGASIPKSAVLLVAGDTFVALLAGFAVFPLVFAHGLEPSSGPGLVFETLPLAFGQMQLGGLVGAVFFLLLMVAALTSCIGSFEPMLCWARERWGMSRARAAIISGLIIWVLGLSTVFSLNILKDFHPLNIIPTFAGKTIFDIQEFVATNVFLVLGGLLMSVFAGWVMSEEILRKAFGLSDGVIFRYLRLVLRYVAPVALFMVLVMGLT
ncbi:MAG: sodium-dependent transporter [Alphaproteobacteria bacterium]|nr:MAG: sodium-dependent transporter [Alphaproteobacteria bacterium]